MNLIFSAFAFKDGFLTSLQTEKKADETTKEMYLKNILVALTSAKNKNPKDHVMLITNCPLPKKWSLCFEENQILVKEVSFDNFLIPREFPWSLAFYKLCALKKVVEESMDQKGIVYEHILMMDGDTYTVKSYHELFQEAEYGILMFPVGHSFDHSDREAIRKDFFRFYAKEAAGTNLVHYGGEFVAGRVEHLQLLLLKCQEIYDKMKESGFKMENQAGDETIWSIAAALMKPEHCIIESGAYIYRFWTGNFYLVSTVTVSNPVCIWHIPNEKETGFLRMYEYYSRKHTYPEVKQAAAMFGIMKAKRPFNRYTLSNKIMGKLSKWKRK